MKQISRRNGLLLVVEFGILFTIPLLWCGFPHGTHDGGGHVNWVECFSGELWRFEWYPRWLASPNHGLGTPAFFYYAPLPYYVTGLFWPLCPAGEQAGFALGWAAALALVLSGVAMFWCLRRFVASNSVAAVGAIVYMAAPYHLCIDLLDRGANAEFWAFVWLPLIIGSLDDFSRLVERTNRIPKNVGLVGNSMVQRFQEPVLEGLKLAIWIACLFLTHVLSAIMFAPLLAGFALFRGWRTMAGLVLAGSVALLLAAVYWIPLVFYIPFVCGTPWVDIGKTMFFPTLEWSKPLTSNDVFNNRLLHIFYGFIVVYGASAMAVVSLRSDRQRQRVVIFFTSALGVYLVMMLPIALPLYHVISALQNIQFSWRFMTCATLAHSLLASILLDSFWNNRVARDLPIFQLWIGRIAGIAILLVMLYSTFIYSIQKYSEAFFDNGKLQAKAVESDIYARDAKGEYIPIGASETEAQNQFPGGDQNPLQPKFLSGSGSATEINKGPRDWKITIQATSPCLILVPQFWFPGWKASVTNGKEFLVVQREPKSGLVQIAVPPGQYEIDLRLCALRPEIIGIYLSFGTAGVIILIGTAFMYQHRRRRSA